MESALCGSPYAAKTALFDGGGPRRRSSVVRNPGGSALVFFRLKGNRSLDEEGSSEVPLGEDGSDRSAVTNSVVGEDSLESISLPL